MRHHLRTTSVLVALVAALAYAATAAASNGNSNAVFSDLQLDYTACTLTVSVSKDVSNYAIDDVKTELGSGTTTLVLQVQANDVVTIKAGTSVWNYTVPADFCGGGGTL
jgi:hypothetical protein